MINGLSRTNPRIRRSRQLRSLEPLEGRLLLATSLGSELAGASILSIPADVTTGVVGPSTSTFFRIEPNAESLLVAEVQAPGSVTQLSLLDDQGNLLVQSDGQTVQDANDLIDQDVSSGTYYLEIQGLGGTAAFTLTTAVTASSTPYEPTPLNLPLPPAIPSPPATGPSSPFSGVPSPFTIPTLPAASTSTGSTAPAVISLSIPPATPSSSTTNPGNTGASSFNNEFDPRNVPAMTSGVFLSDGVLDLADPDGILPGAGDGTFGLPTSPLPIAAKPADVTAMATGDFNDDGRLDLVVASFAHVGQVQILLGSGNGTFDAEPPIDLGAFYPSYLAVGDFEGDGNLGVAIAGTDTSTGGGVVEALSGDGKGGLQPPVSMPMGLGYTPVSMVTGDFTSDGRSDIAVEEKGTEVDVVMMLSNGDGTFQSLPPTSLGSSFNFLEIGGPSGYGNMVAGNFGGGNLDLAVAGSGLFSGGFVMVLPGAGNGRFGTAASIPLGSMSPTSLAVGDFGGDGDLDLAVAGVNSFLSDDNSGNVEVLLGNGALNFSLSRQFEQVDFRPGSLAVGDFNGDGRLDLEVEGTEMSSDDSDWSSCFQVLPGNGDGTFIAPDGAESESQGTVAGTADDTSEDMVTGDFNGDGRQDLVVPSQQSIQLFLGNGDGTFGAPSTVESFGSGMSFDGIVSGDFNGDGKLDLAVLVTLPDDDGEIQVFLGDGDGTFGEPIVTGLGSFSTAALDSTPPLVAGDFEGGDLSDLAVSDGSSLEILMNDGGGTFGAPIPVVLPAFHSPETSALTGIVTFPGETPQLPTTTIEDLMVGDFDGDDHLALAFIQELSVDLLDPTYRVVVVPGNGDGTFGAPVLTDLPPGTDLLGDPIEDVVAGDFHDDGHLDLAITIADVAVSLTDSTEDSWVEILPGEGNGTFGAPSTVYSQAMPVYAASSFISQMLVGDFNGDGVPDLLLYSASFTSNHGEVEILTGSGNGTFGAPSPPFLVASDLPIAVGDFNGDGRLDLAFNADPSTISVDLGLGNGGFVTASQFGSGLQATPMLADLTGNGTVDLLVVDQDGEILWRQGQPYAPGSFDPPIAINPQGPASVAITIIQTDQGPIIASVDRDDNFVTLFADRDGQFLAIGSLATGPLPAQILSADLDDDGDEDLIVRNAGDNSVSIFLGDGDGGFPTERDLPLGSGVLRIALADLDGTGLPDLIVTNSATGTVTVRRNLGNGSFADPSLYAAGSGPYTTGLDPDGIDGIASLDATSAVASGVFTPQGPVGLVVLDPGSNSLAVLEGLIDGALGNPITTLTAGAGEVVSTGDFNKDGLTDLAVLGSDGLSVYMANGRGGFDPPTVYDVGTDPTGLTVADVDHDGKLDLLVGNAEGDVLILLGDGNGGFSPPRESQQAITLAVADLGRGSPDLILADQGLDRVVVDYVSGQSTVLGDQASGVLAPGAVTLADLNGDGIPDLIVANTGGNDILVYPGLGDGQFGQALEGPDGIGFPVGTDPVSVTVADLDGRPDLIVADEGSNDVTILLNEPVVDDFDGPYLPGDTFTFAAGPRLDAGLGPVSTVVQQIEGDTYPDLLVSDSGSNEVTVLQGRGGGYFSDQSPEEIPVGIDPGPLLLGDFGGRPGEVDLVTIDAGSNDLSLIADINGGDVIAQSIPSGGLDPVAGVEGEFDGSLGLLVANNADGHLALFLGGPDGLDLSRTFDVNGLPHPTALVMDASGNIFGGSEGVEAAIPVILGYGASGSGSATPIAAQEPADQQVALVQPLGESAFAMVTTLLSMPGETTSVEGAATAAGLPNQPRSGGISPEDFGGEDPIAETTEAGPSSPPTQAIPPALVRLVAGLDEELAALGLNARRGGLFGESPAHRSTTMHLQAIDQVLARWSPMLGLVGTPSWPAAGGVVRAAAPGVLTVIGGSHQTLGAREDPDNTILPASNERAGVTDTAVPECSDSSEDGDPTDTADVPIGASAVGLAAGMSSLAHLLGPTGLRWRSLVPDSPPRDVPGRGDREPRNRSGSR